MSAVVVQDGTGQSSAQVALPFELSPTLSASLSQTANHLIRCQFLNELYRHGRMRVAVPAGFDDLTQPLDDVAQKLFPESHRLFMAASLGLFSALPVAFDPDFSNEEGVMDDPGLGQENTFYLHAMAVLPTAQNRSELEEAIFAAIATEARESGFAYLSALIEKELFERISSWKSRAETLRDIPDYLGSPFVYTRLALEGADLELK